MPRGGKLAEETSVPAKTIRYYEETGLILPAERASNGYRVYGQRAVHQLRFVKRARDLGFTMEEVSSLLALWGDEERSSADVKEIAAQHLADVERKILELKNLRKTMRNLIDSCHGDERADCPILDDLASSGTLVGQCRKIHEVACVECTFGSISARTAGRTKLHRPLAVALAVIL